MFNNFFQNNLIQEAQNTLFQSFEPILKDLVNLKEQNKKYPDSTSNPEPNNSEESQHSNTLVASIEVDETTESSISSSLAEIRDGWLGDSNNSWQHQNIASFRCNCPSCCSGILPSDLVTESSSTPSDETITPNTLEFDKIEALLSSYQWNSNTITYSFYEDDVFNGSYYDYATETNVREVSDKIKENVREIVDWLETVVDIDFVEVEETDTNTYGQIRYMFSDGPNYAYAYYPNNYWDIGGDIHFNPSYDYEGGTNGFQNDPGKHGYMSIIHEMFHALGLKHPQDGNPNLTTSDDNTAHTVMSYKFTGNSAGTAMPYDIAALQYMYGAKDHNTGDDTYTFGSTTDVLSVNGDTVLETPHRVKQTIWDSNGIDTLDFSQLSLNSSGYSFDLNPGGWLIANNVNQQSSNSGNYYNYGTSIAFDVTIENIIASSSNDYIIANDAANIFGGYDYGIAVGNDTLVNTDGLDILDLSGYSASDIIQTQNNNDLVIDLEGYGSVTVEDYFVSGIDNRLQIQLQEDTISLITTEDPNNNVTIGEIGRIDAVNHNLQTIQLQGNYTNPVVFAQPLSQNGGQTSILRVTDIQSDSLSFYVQQAESLDGSHVNESFSYMVVEAGTWQLADGTLLEVGTFTSNSNVGGEWETLNFQSDFVETPVVLSQIQTTNNSEFIRTRQNNAGVNGFDLALEKEESLKSSEYQQDSIGWLAISSGEGTWDGNYYQATNTGNQVQHEWYGLDLSPNFTETPEILASIATYDGVDSAGLRSREITGANGSTVEIRIEEDKSLDNEIVHTTEDVNFFAIEGTGLLTAQVYNPAANSWALDPNTGFSNEESVLGLDLVADI
ncbi:MAG: M10 family metallopeptidase [Xenococcaceae cyanobacterium MO_207.B15]|nr:M10 family metallopeptidase [Xenococcaceae cyanobacterium MO_207.B15]